MTNKNMIIPAVIADAVLLVVFTICLVLVMNDSRADPAPTPLEEELATDEIPASETPEPTRIPSATVVLVPMLTPSLTRQPVPSTVEIEEPTKLPYVFPTPIRIEPAPRPIPTPTGTRTPR